MPMPIEEPPRSRTPLKWAGNKYRVLEHIKSRLPAGRRLIEPFTGSAALFLNTRYPHYLLNDINPDLIHFYRTLQQHGAEFIRYAERFFTDKHNTKTAYYEHRERFNSSRRSRLKAALFLYLNRHGYNGLCRYNASGRFNVPFGRYKRPYFPAKELTLFAEKAQGIAFTSDDFATTLRQARAGDVVYCDPPYVPLSATASFTAYSAGGFGPAQQAMLAELASELASQGVPVLISNHCTPATRVLYAQAATSEFAVRRTISCSAMQRNEVSELLAVYKPQQSEMR